MTAAPLLENLRSPIDNFYHWERTTPDTIFLRQPQGASWKTLTYAQAGQEARRMARALQKMGLQKGDHVGIYSKNCYHWILADLAIMIGDFVSVPFYASLPRTSLQEVIVLSDLKALFIGKLDHWGDKAAALPTALEVITFPHYPSNAQVPVGHSWEELVAKNEALNTSTSPDLDSLWTILYTSGTTGTPKGVMHSFRNPAIVFRIEELTNFTGALQMKNTQFFSFLPLNHVAERIGVETNCLANGGTISFAESLDTFAQNLQDTQPSFLFAVPRIWTKFYQGVLAKIPEKRLNLLLRIPLINRLVKKRIKQALGMSRAEIVGTGAAITPEYLKKWYKKFNLHLVEAYGMTEVCGSICNGPQLDAPADSVGSPVPYCEVKIHPETQEILMKAPYQMLGYYKNPEKTAEVLKDGWIYSGDRGTIDERGFVRVIGRVKDAFKTSKGQYIIPNPMEEILAENDYVEQVCVVGLGCSQPLAVVNLSEAGKVASPSEIETSLRGALKKTNANLSNYTKISTIIIDRETWSESNEILTPTMKVRRPSIDEIYGNQYQDWHEKPGQIIWK